MPPALFPTFAGVWARSIVTPRGAHVVFFHLVDKFVY